MEKIFVLANGRSGTKYLSELFKYNVKNCVTKHEPFPDMFGKPILWYEKGNTKELERVFEWKKNRINRYKASVYIETNHAFLKSFCDMAMKFFPDMKLIHLIRDPIKTAKSELNRHLLSEQLHVPFYYFKDHQGNKYFRFALTGNEEIYKSIGDSNISLFQKYVLQWIEVENRAMKFLDKYNKHDVCYTMNSPEELNNVDIVEQMFKFFNLELKHDNIIVKGKKNKNTKPTIITDEDKKQFEEIVNRLPDDYLKNFKKEPYIKYEWSSTLNKK